MKAIYRFGLCTTYSPVEGIFVIDEKYVNYMIDNKCVLYFGEVDGKYSEIEEEMGKDNFYKVTEDPETIRLFEAYNLETGINPFNCTKQINLDEYGEMYEETYMDFINKKLNENN